MNELRDVVKDAMERHLRKENASHHQAAFPKFLWGILRVLQRRHSQEELQASIVNESVRYSTLVEE